MAPTTSTRAILEATERFLEALLDRVEKAHYLEIRALGGALARPRQFLLPIDAVLQRGLPLAVLALDGQANVYYSAIPRAARGGKGTDCGSAPAVWGDFDSGAPHGGVPLAPSLVVETSPGRYQAQWLLDRPSADLSLVERINRSIALGYAADPNACDRARVLRLPGFQNVKYPARPRAGLLACEPSHRYPLADLAATFPPSATPPPLRAARYPASDAPPWLALVYDAILDHLAAQGLRWHPNGEGVISQCPFDSLGARGDFSLSIHPQRGFKDFGEHGEGRLTGLAYRLGLNITTREDS